MFSLLKQRVNSLILHKKEEETKADEVTRVSIGGGSQKIKRNTLGWEEESTIRRPRSAKNIIYSDLSWSLENVNVKAALELLYAIHAPEKVSQAARIMSKYINNEKKLLQELCETYELSEKDMQQVGRVGKG